MSLVTLVRREPGPIGFGLLHTLAATIGQTFVISLFLPGIKASFGLGDAAVSLLFTTTTLASAAALWKSGAWIDRVDVLRYCLVCGVFLAVACLLMAGAFDLSMLVVGLFCLRLAGNGLLTHVALTATARYFSRDRGQALSLVLLGSAVGEVALPGLLVALIGAFDWRVTLAAVGLLGLIIVVLAAAAIRRNPRFRSQQVQAAHVGPEALQPARPRVQGSDRRYFWLAAPLFVGMPMAVTAAIFHQALLAATMAVPLQWFAVSYMVFAVSRVGVSLATGPLIDRIGSRWLFCFHLVPLAIGFAALVTLQSPWIVPFFWFAAGIASGMGTILQTTVVAERVALSRLGRARSLLAAVTIVASAVGPSLYGLGLAAGAGVPALLWGTVAALLAATSIGFIASRRVEDKMPKTPLPVDATTDR